MKKIIFYIIFISSILFAQNFDILEYAAQKALQEKKYQKLNLIIKIYIFNKDYNKAKQLLFEIEKTNIYLSQKLDLAKSFNDVGEKQKAQTLIHKTYLQTLKNNKKKDTHSFKENMANIAKCFIETGFYIDALKVIREIDDSTHQGKKQVTYYKSELYRKISKAYKQQKRYPLAIKMLKKMYDKSSQLNELLNIYIHMKDDKKFLDVIELANQSIGMRTKEYIIPDSKLHLMSDNMLIATATFLGKANQEKPQILDMGEDEEDIVTDNIDSSLSIVCKELLKRNQIAIAQQTIAKLQSNYYKKTLRGAIVSKYFEQLFQNKSNNIDKKVIDNLHKKIGKKYFYELQFKEYLKINRLDLAAVSAEKLQKISKYSAMLNIAKKHITLGNNNTAIIFLDKAKQALEPYHTTSLLTIVRYYEQLGAKNRAQFLLQKIENTINEFVSSSYKKYDFQRILNLISYYRNIGDQENALALTKKSLLHLGEYSLSDDDKDYYYGRVGVLLIALKKYKQGIQAIEEAWSHHYRDHDYYDPDDFARAIISDLINEECYQQVFTVKQDVSWINIEAHDSHEIEKLIIGLLEIGKTKKAVEFIFLERFDVELYDYQKNGFMDQKTLIDLLVEYTAQNTEHHHRLLKEMSRFMKKQKIIIDHLILLHIYFDKSKFGIPKDLQKLIIDSSKKHKKNHNNDQ
ncbi:hypothetical protein [Candidatus Uabimicrobium sp. HlEnr_7]|uniref:hypothetical protein n=1 Tax=Candidatus Uabimicrobium helgolandensis TaxID=3095367 RepID=UPI003557867F